MRFFERHGVCRRAGHGGTVVYLGYGRSGIEGKDTLGSNRPVDFLLMIVM